MADVNRIDDTSGDTTLQGTNAPDLFVFGVGYTDDDTITGFTNGTDRIDLTRFQGITRLEDLTVRSDDNDVVIDLTEHGGGTIRLTGFNIDDLDASDFVFSTLDGGGTSGDDRLYADNDGDRIEGGAGHDKIIGGAGSDILIGGTGDDSLDGGGGHDWLEGGEGNDELDGGAGDDVLSGGTGEDLLGGGEGDDILAGHEDDDELYGSEGDDSLDGGSGDDELDGGTGDDTMWGGTGHDKFVFEARHGNDTIEDFTDGEDAIDLTELTGVSGFADLTITADGNDAVINLVSHGGGTIRLEDFEVADLDASDFRFYEPPVDPAVEGA